MQRLSPAGYSATQILIHWVMAALVFFLLLFGESMKEVLDAAEEGKTVSASDQFLADGHYWAGLTVLGLVAVRLILRFRHGAPLAAGSEVSLMSRAAGAMHWLFYVLLLLVPATGLLAFYGFDEVGEIHEIGKPAFIVLITLHAAAALFHQFWIKDGALKRMFVPS